MRHPMIRVKAGQRVQIIAPWSEVCAWMRVADKPMLAELLDEKRGMVQLYDLDGTIFSAPITSGEAGFYQDGQGYYTYGVNVAPAEQIVAA